MAPKRFLPNFLALVMCSLPVMTVAAEQSGDAASTQPQTAVRVITSQERLLAGLPVKAWRATLDGTMWEETEQEASFDGRNCYLQLPPGEYRFEVLVVLQSGEVLCVRSAKTTVASEAVTVEMPAVTKHRLLLKHRGRTLPINHLAIASLGNQEARLESVRGAKVGTILAVPGEPLSLNVIGGNKKLIVAGWRKLDAQRKMEISTDDDWRKTAFTIDADTPRLKAAQVELLFPTTKIAVSPDGPFTLITNRQVVRMSYGLISTHGPRLVVRESFVDLDKTSQVKLGGRLHVEAWAAVLSRDNGEKTLRWEATLLDSERREVWLDKSELGWKSAIRFQSGDLASSSPLSEESQKLVGRPEESMECLATWNWGGTHQFVEAPSPLVEYTSQHFIIHAPRPWQHRTNGYLGVLERTFQACQARTERTGPDQIDIRWRTNTHSAKARVGGRKSWMSMPFRGLELATDPFRRPWFMAHEMLHTFGYNHGPEMTRLVDEAAFVVDSARWLATTQHDHLSLSTKLPRKPQIGDIPAKVGETAE